MNQETKSPKEEESVEEERGSHQQIDCDRGCGSHKAVGTNDATNDRTSLEDVVVFDKAGLL